MGSRQGVAHTSERTSEPAQRKPILDYSAGADTSVIVPMAPATLCPLDIQSALVPRKRGSLGTYDGGGDQTLCRNPCSPRGQWPDPHGGTEAVLF